MTAMENGYGDMEYKVTEERLGSPKHLKVVMIGGGASGMNLARHMDLHMKNYELVIYEKNADIGGTWFENRYAINRTDRSADKYNVTDILAAHAISHLTTISLHGSPIQSGLICTHETANDTLNKAC